MNARRFTRSMAMTGASHLTADMESADTDDARSWPKGHVAALAACARVLPVVPDLVASLEWALGFIEAGETDRPTERRLQRARAALSRASPGNERTPL